jgi:3'-5' exoribonuclease
MNSPPRLAIQPSLGAPVTSPDGRVFVRELADGDHVSGAFAVRERSRRSRKNGEDFVTLVLADRTGAIEAVAWDDVEDCFAQAQPGIVVFI